MQILSLVKYCILRQAQPNFHDVSKGQRISTGGLFAGIMISVAMLSVSISHTLWRYVVSCLPNLGQYECPQPTFSLPKMHDCCPINNSALRRNHLSLIRHSGKVRLYAQEVLESTSSYGALATAHHASTQTSNLQKFQPFLRMFLSRLIR